MSETKTLRLSKVAKELNIGLHNIVEFLETHGHHIETNPNAKIDDAQYELLLKEFQSEKLEKEKQAASGSTTAVPVKDSTKTVK